MKLNQAELYIKELLTSMGLGDFSVQLYLNTHNAGMNLSLHKKLLESPLAGEQDLLNKLSEIYDNIANSPTVRDMTANLELKVKHLTEQVEELKSYKVYYDMHKKMSKD